MRKTIVANWKCNGDMQTVQAVINTINSIQSNTINEVVLALPSVYLYYASQILQKTIKLSAQDISQFNEGAYTGEISGNMIKSVGADYVIIGHSERRTYFHESKNIIQKKLTNAVSASLMPLLCIGEDLLNKDGVCQFLTEELSVILTLNISHIAIAYEPIWAIGTGITPTLESINNAVFFIKNFCIDNNIKANVLYGGSVNIKNASDILKICDGVLIGSASLTEDFVRILEFVF